MSKKKPTKKDIEIVVSNLIRHVQTLSGNIDAVDNLFGLYIKYKKDDKGFKKYIQKQVELAADGRRDK